ncbi:hypothetical protein BZG36_05373 [Bifiguratus adelaidae]|uniref:Thiaminase-2/PQQC domain-containing protein n=1 Tax=Bifiguratus adelaidae TaxID=1938954 RepID=A0A261XUM2_9FUNG|nr:hypothetical protein BZG36_05373 [Bifiguratus adelaidae]
MSCNSSRELADSIVEAAGEQYKKVTSDAKFIQAVGDGSISTAQFNRWLSEDYYFVVVTIKAVSALLVFLPSESTKTLIAALGAFSEELSFFRQHIKEKDLKDLPAGDLDQTNVRAEVSNDSPLKDYNSHTEEITTKALSGNPRDVWRLLVFHYMAERCYYDAWASVANPPPAYQEFVTRWASDAFKAYIERLERIVLLYYNQLKTDIPETDLLHVSQDESRYVVQAEDDFWNYCMS